MTLIDSATEVAMPTADHRPSPLLAALSGAAGGGLALGLTELGDGLLDSMPSLIGSVAAQVTTILPGDLITWAIETFGESDRAIIGVSITLIVVAIGAVAGLAHRKGSGLGAGLFSSFALVGAVASLANFNANLLVVLVVSGVAAFCGWWTMAWLQRHYVPDGAATTVATATAGGDNAGTDTGPVTRGGHPDDRAGVTLDRRQFMAAAGAVGGVAALTAVSGRSLAARPTVGTATDGPVSATIPPVADPLAQVADATSFDIDGLTPLFVPNDDFYRIDTAQAGVPVIDLPSWELRIHGMVDDELTFNFEELVDRGMIESDITIACVSNQVGGGLIGNARWTGVPLGSLLEEAGVSPDGGQVVGRSVDGFTVGFPTEVAMDGRDAMIAVAMNGEPLPLEHGYPARLIVPGLYGYVSATKWLSDIEITGWDDFDAYWVPLGWSKRGPIKTQSRIDTPSNGANITAGEVVVAGVAWAQPRGIERVEVQVDGGDWVEAELAEAINDNTWVQWRAGVQLTAGEHDLTVRATDTTGMTQPAEYTAEHPNGAEGWHNVAVNVG